MHLTAKQHIRTAFFVCHVIIPLLECILVTAACTFLVLSFLRICNADGYNAILYAWVILTCILLYVSHRFAHVPRSINRCARVLSAALIICGAFLVLIQIAVAQRSLAEAWLDYMRKGEPFGFFSFFAAEIYALLLIIAVRFASSKNYVYALCIAAAIHCLCAGLITGFQILFVLSFCFLAVPLFLKRRWASFCVPCAVAAILAAVFSFSAKSDNGTGWHTPSVDFSRIASAIAPDFPLLVHIPGYGTSVKTARPLQSVALSSRSIFSVTGRPYSTLYFSKERFWSWNGAQWLPAAQTPAEDTAAVTFPSDTSHKNEIPENAERITMKLLDDFYSVVLCTPYTIAAQIPDECALSDVIVGSGDSLFLQPGMHRGAHVTLFTVPESQQYLLHKKAADIVSFNSSVIPPLLENFAVFTAGSDVTLLQSDRSSVDSALYNAAVRRYIDAVLTHFCTQGFVYSLESPAVPPEQNPFDYFFFESKKGFCTWYAGAFTLLMHAMNIPCRISEGYRVSLDGTGRAHISGLQSHAWPEVFVDGAWRIIEATPVFLSENPFAYINQNDQRTLRQFKEQHDEPLQKEAPSFFAVSMLHTLYPRILFVLMCAAVIVFVVFLLRYYTKTPPVVRSARRLVRDYRDVGVPSPSEIGWLEWRRRVLQLPERISSAKESKDATDAADAMIAYLYRP